MLTRSPGNGDPGRDALPPSVYEELRRLALAVMRGERRDHTLQPTALAHEAYLRLARGRGLPESLSAEDRASLAVAAARAMRRILIDHARARQAAKRSADPASIPREEQAAPGHGDAGGPLLELDLALERLGRMDSELARIVELRFFGGCTVEETAELVGISPRSVKRAWRVAKGWLRREITEGSA